MNWLTPLYLHVLEPIELGVLQVLLLRRTEWVHFDGVELRALRGLHCLLHLMKVLPRT